MSITVYNLTRFRTQVERQFDEDNGGSWTSDFQEGVDYVFILLREWNLDIVGPSDETP